MQKYVHLYLHMKIHYNFILNCYSVIRCVNRHICYIVAESKAESMVMVFFRCNLCLFGQFYENVAGVTRTPREKPEMILQGWRRISTRFVNYIEGIVEPQTSNFLRNSRIIKDRVPHSDISSFESRSRLDSGTLSQNKSAV